MESERDFERSLPPQRFRRFGAASSEEQKPWCLLAAALGIDADFPWSAAVPDCPMVEKGVVAPWPWPLGSTTLIQGGAPVR